MSSELPALPAKRYFTIGEVAQLCGVKPHVLRYWEQEFTQLRPMKRRGNRRYYQHHEVLMIRRIRELLYEQGFTISGARNRLLERPQGAQPVVALEELSWALLLRRWPLLPACCRTWPRPGCRQGRSIPQRCAGNLKKFAQFSFEAVFLHIIDVLSACSAAW